MTNSQQLLQRLEKLTELGIALSAERDITRLLEKILLGAKLLSNADAGTLYSVGDDGQIHIETMYNDSLGIVRGGTSGNAVELPSIPLTDNNEPNLRNVVSYAVHARKPVNIEDAYDHPGFDFAGMRKFDDELGYRSRSFLTVPMQNHEGEIIGVLQQINARDTDGTIIPFDEQVQQLVEALASQAAVALTNQRLIDDQQRLIDSIIKLIATAIDEKSPYTGGHCRRVPVLTMLLADAAHAAEHGNLKDFRLSDQERYALETAAWLHDCGKITTPEYVVDKATKLETIYDRVHTIGTRFEVLKRDVEIALLRRVLGRMPDNVSATAEREIRDELAANSRQLDDEYEVIRRHNTGAEFMADEAKQQIRDIGRRQLSLGGQTTTLLSDDEIYNLTIDRGTLTPEERQIINNHIVATINMLEALPFPMHLKNVPEYAGGHHERMDGKGYPRGLTGDQMSVPARAMAIADVFEALTARDRPYKKGKSLTEALHILGRMKLDNHIDPDLFQLFIDRRLYLEYAGQFLDPEQIDDVDIDSIPGYIASENLPAD